MGARELPEDAHLAAARSLYDAIVAPAARWLGEGDRLLVVPDGPLFYLPFAALHDGSRYLIERHAVAYAPSASVLDPALRGRRPARRCV